MVDLAEALWYVIAGHPFWVMLCPIILWTMYGLAVLNKYLLTHSSACVSAGFVSKKKCFQMFHNFPCTMLYQFKCLGTKCLNSTGYLIRCGESLWSYQSAHNKQAQLVSATWYSSICRHLFQNILKSLAIL